MTVDDHFERPWPTLTDAAASTGYTREALRQRVLRGKLKAMRGNDGRDLAMDVLLARRGSYRARRDWRSMSPG